MLIKYSLLWYFSSLIIFILAVFPFIIEWVAELFGFITLSDLITSVMIGILLFLTMSLTIITTGQNKKKSFNTRDIYVKRKK